MNAYQLSISTDDLLTITKAPIYNYFYECFNHSFPSLSNPAPLDPSDCPASILCTEEFVREMLYSLNPAKSIGLDGVFAFMLKSTATVIAPSLTKLFNPSVSTGSFPSAWKNARITPSSNLPTHLFRKTISQSLFCPL